MALSKRRISRRQQALKLAAAASADPRTVQKWLRRQPVSHPYDILFEQLAEKLGIQQDPTK